LIGVPSRRRIAVVLVGAMLAFTGCGSPTAPPSPPAPAMATCDWRLTSHAFPGMDAALNPPLRVPAQGHRIMTITTDRGVITVDIDLSRTPCTGASLAFLVGRHYYDHAACQLLAATANALTCANPSEDPAIGPGYQFDDENVPAAYRPGDVGLDNDGPNSNGSAFFFVSGPTGLPGRYPLWGHVTSGLGITAVGSLTFTAVTLGPVG
jgi:peptidyl-prolyl cis-trans isomerase B (cyclophilin B)